MEREYGEEGRAFGKDENIGTSLRVGVLCDGELAGLRIGWMEHVTYGNLGRLVGGLYIVDGCDLLSGEKPIRERLYGRFCCEETSLIHRSV